MDATALRCDRNNINLDRQCFRKMHPGDYHDYYKFKEDIVVKCRHAYRRSAVDDASLRSLLDVTQRRFE